MPERPDDAAYQDYLAKKRDGMEARRTLQERKRRHKAALDAFKAVKRTEPRLQYRIEAIHEHDGEPPRIVVRVRAPYVRRKTALFRRFKAKLAAHPGLTGVRVVLVRPLPGQAEQR